MPPVKKSGSSGSRKRPGRDAPPALTAVPTRPEDVAANFAILRDRLVSSVTLTTERLQDTVDDAVRRGRITRKDAEDLLSALVSAGRSQTEALLSDLEQLLGRGAAMRVRTADHAETVRRTVDAARRRVSGTPPAVAEDAEEVEEAAPAGGLPIEGYDGMTAVQITKALKDLTPADLRKIRDHERANANRKSVLAAVERKLG
ncbi:MAG TPA: hypothetical protein VFT50_14245 [Baekduia sp.]|nr:hypothetical protein [Baekduia sp.]